MKFDPAATPEARQQALSQFVQQLNADNRPIMVGPWRSEVGFEVSYWLPFLASLKRRVKDFDKRASIVARGGLAPLYGHLAAQGFDLYALRDVTEVRRENLYDQRVKQKGATIKQLEPTAWDASVLEDAAVELGIGMAYHVVHPAWMYWALAPYWEMERGLKYLTTMADFGQLPKITVDVALPPKYVAVKFYARATFPYPNQEVSQWVQKAVATLATQCPVLLLSSPAEHDDHVDIPIAGPNVQSLPVVPPEQNLLVQAAVLSHATAFVGTYGGSAQLALSLGIPTCGVWLKFAGTSPAHLSLSTWFSQQTKVPFITGSLAETDFWRQILVADGTSVGEKTMRLGVVAA